ncbi:hypothetical protein [Arthrobacter rhombi]|uniref:hypothetical protein n=1 Tax=Arthrobacter rhombi TaxID=71253 RepID=UPI003FD20631
MDDTPGWAFPSEVLGTAILPLPGAGVVANVLLSKNKGFNNGQGSRRVGHPAHNFHFHQDKEQL